MSLDNEGRATLGADAVSIAARQTNVAVVESAQTAVTDVLAYVAHFCDRLGLNPRETFDAGLRSYEGDFEDGPAARPTLDAELPLAELALDDQP
ncbi:MAG: hypothetical protein LC798_12025 [Chloroflexi bacterium]|nr:hypothetical protein [Chloroflexota bacterium]